MATWGCLRNYVLVSAEKREAAAQRMRLEELGLLPGTRIQCLYQAPCGTPAAYAVSGAVFALRRKDAARLLVEAVS